MTTPKTIVSVLDPSTFMTTAGDTVEDLLSEGGGVLDESCVTDTFLFQAEDGKFYVGSFEFVVNPAGSEYVVETLTGSFAKCPSCGHLQNVDEANPIGSEDTEGDCLCDKCTHICFKLTKEQAQALVLPKKSTPKAPKKPVRRRHVGLK